MARTRALKPQYFKNDLLAECQPLARLLFAGLWCMADAEGRLEYRPLRVKAEILPYDNCDVDELVLELEQRGFVRRYRVEDVTVLVVPKFLEHQRPHPKEPVESLPLEENDTAGNKFVRAVNIHGTAGNKFVRAVYDCAFNPSPSYPSPSNPSAMVPEVSATLPERQSQTAPLGWDATGGWKGITDEDRQSWATAYPAAGLAVELAKASEWLKANPLKAKRTNWRKFLVGWLTRCQDGGGTQRGNGRRQEDERPPPKSWGDSLIPAPYRTPKEALRLKASR